MSYRSDLADYLQPSQFIDSDHPDIQAQTKSVIDEDSSELENALKLYYWVRDEIRYNPYTLVPSPDAYLAHATLNAGEGWCVPKALLLAAMCRAAQIPARVGFADVRNHLSTQRLRDTMQSDIFYFHGYTSIYLEDKWVKATPAFNIELCNKFGLHPLEFNGREDSLYHEFDVEGNRHMEYLNDRGEHLDLPFDEMTRVFSKYYPDTVIDIGQQHAEHPEQVDWDADVDKEVGLG